MLQRMSLLSGGEYDVWGFTWEDIDAAFDRFAQLPPMLLNPAKGALKDWYRDLGLVPWANVLDTTPLELLLRTLANPENQIPWFRLGAIALVAQMVPSDSMNPQAWQREVAAIVPAPMRKAFTLDPNWLYARRPSDASNAMGIWVTVSLAAAGDREYSLQNDYRAILWLDDAQERRDTNEFRAAWRGYLFAFLMLRNLPQALFLTRTGSRSETGYAKLAQLRQGVTSKLDEQWAALEVGLGVEKLVEALSETGIPLPEVGVDLPNARGLSSGIEGELVWEKQRIAVTRTVESGRDRIASDWKVFTVDECLVNVVLLVNAFKGNSQGEQA